ncbi:MAG: hypothetical protein CL609_02800 [Anaerolineaceae bacterium]|nr:hypothetical protein [Anaerolineaceae bacterium]
MRNEFTLAFNEVLEEKGLPKDVILKALESAMASAYRRSVNASNAQRIESTVDIETGKVTIYAEKEVVEDVQDERTEVTLEEAKRYDEDIALGMMILVESTPKNFGRVAAQTARQVIQQRIRDAERNAQLDHYADQLGEIVSGVVQAANSQGLTIGLELKAEGTMLRKDMIPGERFHVHDRVRSLIAEVKDTPRGPQILLSRTHRNFLRRLLETEVPEIYHGIVEIRSITREPGQRAKVAVSATQAGIDPVGACVGLRGVRIQAIVRELHDEKIDVIEWHEDPGQFIARAISPARVNGVYLTETSEGGRTATVVVPEDQLSLAIGRDGQNARLAAKLTGWRIDIKSLPEAASEALYKLQNDSSLAEMTLHEKETVEEVEAMLAKKANGGILTPENYNVIAAFVDRVEKRSFLRTQAEEAAEKERLAQMHAEIPPSFFETDILDSSLPEHVNYILQEANINTVAELVVKMMQQPDDIIRLNGMGPRAMKSIDKLMASLPEKLAEETAAMEAQKIAEVVSVEESEPETEAALETTVEAEPETVETVEQEEESFTEMEEVQEEETSEEEIDLEQYKSVDKIIEDSIAKPEVIETPTTEAEEEEEELSFDKLFELQSTAKDFVFPDSDSEEIETEEKGKKGKKGKKKRHVHVEYDEDEDQVIHLKKHKRGAESEWTEWE